MNKDGKILLLQILFVTCILLANTIGVKIIQIGPVSASFGIWLFPFTFLITDILTEVKGKKMVTNLIWSTAIALIFTYIFIQLSIWAEPATRYAETNQSFVAIFKSSARIVLASIVAFVISQSHDVWAFEFWKQKTKGKYLWLRNNLSTIVSQLIDTIIFIFIAFYNVSPKFDFAFMWQLIIPYYILKVIIAILDTPFVYLGVKWLKEKNDNQ